MEIEKLTGKNLISTLQNETKPVIIDFYSDWCVPCGKMSAILEEIASENQNVAIYKIDTEKELNLALQFSIVNIPTLIIIKEGKIQSTIVGVHSKEFIIDQLKNN